ncbi:Atg6/Beclin [Thamnocephalis sphaerospora]|uniref:Atg6/Beclin n=1 Tax=Thamnocephalis sphaerospora TaxID=78915 RepID=A0A4P9XLP1_9FUNG|nr:Atg6/Beclin [Thamnocephalis sphaerospora]RKP10589.1 Atg6/Beclin [Thamnocephalis sphaerospora]|eukprot:RKP06793.1 Atg6/Beclin [Thamnocephalis sphaerospora]
MPTERLEHPLCLRCTNRLQDVMSQQLAALIMDRDKYAEFLGQMDASLPDAEEQSALDEKLKSLHEEEQTYLEALRELEAQLTSAQTEMEQLKKESKELDELERSRWESLNEYETRLCELNAERDSLELSLRQAADWMMTISSSNAYNDAFRIRHDGEIGTINGLRLGRLPTHPVEWPEINAAWGQTLLLLQILCNRTGLQLERYRAVPRGSFSRIDRIDGDSSQYELYNTGDFQLDRMFLNRRFDKAMVAFIDCLQQLSSHVSHQCPDYQPPYRINGDRVGDACIRLQYNDNTKWTCALLRMLIILKRLMAFCCRPSSSSASSTSTVRRGAPRPHPAVGMLEDTSAA